MPNPTPPIMYTYLVLVLATIFGLVVAESCYLGLALSKTITPSLDRIDPFILLVSVALILASLLFLTANNSYVRYALKVIEHNRFDLVLCFILGTAISFLFSGIGSRLYNLISDSLTPTQACTLLLTPLFYTTTIRIKTGLSQLRSAHENKEVVPSQFLNDTEITRSDDDLLDMSEDARKFAEQVTASMSTRGLIFGLDAPWGTGKSSFLCLSEAHWRANENEKPIICKFSALSNIGSKPIIDMYLESLCSVVTEKIFMPELSPMLQRYARQIKGRSKIGIPGISVELEHYLENHDLIMNSLQQILCGLNYKLIVIMDDLDRLEFDEIRTLIFTIRKYFSLANIIHILCYDTSNLTRFSRDSLDQATINAYFEKFINVKFSIFVSPKMLSKFVSVNCQEYIMQRLLVDPALLNTAIGGLKDVYDRADDFDKYSPYIGDLRKIKRLINLIMILDISEVDFQNTDILPLDLLHLLLLYTYFPEIFRKLYQSEANDGKGIFSLVYMKEGESRNYSWQNHQEFQEYLDSHTEAAFLLEKLFDASRVEKYKGRDVPDEIFHGYCCFNGNMGAPRNLQTYLDLIVSRSKPILTEEYSFYSRIKNDLLVGKTLEQVFDEHPEFNIAAGDVSRRKLWDVIVNSAEQFSDAMGNALISYILQSIKTYSLYGGRSEPEGMRDRLSIYLVLLLDKIGWEYEFRKSGENTDKNIMGIADWIYGEGSHSEEGVIDQLSSYDRGILGFYDLLNFRLRSSAGRGHNYNLHRALALHGNSNAITSGPVSEIIVEQMRELSQKTFLIFNERYIKNDRNILDEIYRLTFEQLTGNWSEYCREAILQVKKEPQSVDEWVNSTRNSIASFILYQLASHIVGTGVGCGYYDEVGSADKQGIRDMVNEYLFNTCFSGPPNYEHFINFAIHTSRSYRDPEDGLTKADISPLRQLLDDAKLRHYWRENRRRILYTAMTSGKHETFLHVENELDRLLDHTQGSTSSPTE